jgi:GNAT superfamily N-acetyltransferase
VASGSIVRDQLPVSPRKRLPSYPLPILRLARLAVSKRHQGRGIAKLLLRAVFGVAHLQAENVGCVGVVVDAKEDALAFYLPYGFEPVEVARGALETHPEPVLLFLELGAIPRER